MNTDTGRIYVTEESIQAALQRGEPLARVSERVARTMRAGEMALSSRERRRAKADRKRQQGRRP